MSDLNSLIFDAWRRIAPALQPDHLAQRLARRRSATLLRPPRAWCLAIRASDTRLTPMVAPMSPEQAMYLPNPWSTTYRLEHDVTLNASVVRMLSRPVHIDPPEEDAAVVARKLGCTPASLMHTRRLGVFSERKIKNLGGKWGHPVPVLFTRDLLDPCSGRLRKAADIVWGTQWRWLCEHVPDDIEQTITRVPVYVPDRRAGVGQPHARGGGASVHGVPAEIFLGWKWLCPACKRPVRIVYYPLPCFRTLLLLKHEFPPDHPDALPDRPGGFACFACHRIRFLPRFDRNNWNFLIAQLSGGLLYGREVLQPDWFRAGALRQRRYSPQLFRTAPRREIVLHALLAGKSIRRIAIDMNISIRGVLNHVRSLCRQEHVPDRHALAGKLGSPPPQPLNQDERARARRAKVQHLILRGYTYKEIMKELDTDFSAVNRDTWKIYKSHGVSGRRALARKLGITLPTIHETRRGLIQKRLLARETYPQIAQALAVNWNCVHYHAKCIYKEQGVTGREGLIVKFREINTKL